MLYCIFISIQACAPRLVWFSEPALSNKAREPTGTCYVGHANFTNFVEYSPCQDSKLLIISTCSESVLPGGVGRLWANKALEGQVIVHKQWIAPPMLCFPIAFRCPWVLLHFCCCYTLLSNVMDLQMYMYKQ